jgi:hypothetical protein
MSDAATDTVEIEHVDGLDTKVVLAYDLNHDDYVLIPEDVHDESVPLVVPADHEAPLLYRVAGWVGGEDADGFTTLRLDGPDGEVVDIGVSATAEIRMVLPHQDFEKW